jgi:hypothetical protein
VLLLGQEVAVEVPDNEVTPSTKVTSSFKNTDVRIANVRLTDIDRQSRETLANTVSDSLM